MGPVKKAVKSIFSPPKPKLPPVTEVATRENSAAEIAQAAEDDKQKRARQAGRGATLLSKGAIGDDSTGAAGLLK